MGGTPPPLVGGEAPPFGLAGAVVEFASSHPRAEGEPTSLQAPQSTVETIATRLPAAAVPDLQTGGGASTSSRTLVSRAPLLPPLASSTAAPLRWLLVDDVGSNLLFLRNLLARRRPGDDFAVAHNGAEALAAVAAGVAPFDVVVLDKEMPVCDGHEAARTLRAQHFTGMIVGCTGNAQPADRTAFLAAGADHVLFKPVDVAALLALADERRPQAA